MGDAREEQEQVGALGLGWKIGYCEAQCQGALGILGHSPWWAQLGNKALHSPKARLHGAQFRTWNSMNCQQEMNRNRSGLLHRARGARNWQSHQDRCAGAVSSWTLSTWARQRELVQWYYSCIFHSLRSFWIFFLLSWTFMTHALRWVCNRKTKYCQ